MNKEIKDLYRKKKTAEFTVFLGGFITMLTALSYQMNGHVIYNGIALVIGLLMVFFGVSNFSHLKETFKETFISKNLSEWMKGGDYFQFVGLSKLQVYGSDFFNPADKFHSEALITGTVDNIPFLSSDLMLYEKKNDTHPFFNGRLFIFEFNNALNLDFLALQDKTKPVATKQYNYSEKYSTKLNKQYSIYTTTLPKIKALFTDDFVEYMNNLNRLHRDTINFALKEAKMYISFNDHVDTFRLKFLRPLNKQQLSRFQEDVKVIRNLLNEIKNNQKLFF